VLGWVCYFLFLSFPVSQVGGVSVHGSHWVSVEYLVACEWADGVELRFEQVAGIFKDLDIDHVWANAEDEERRVLVEEFVDSLWVFLFHMEDKVIGASPLKVHLGEVGLKVPEIVGLEGPT
jgi:hypothetical protein